MPQLLPALLAGLLFGYFTILSGSLWMTVVIHCCYNLMAAAVELAGTIGGPEAQLRTSAGFAAVSFIWCGLAVLWIIRRDWPELDRYQGPLTLVERLQGMACNVPLLVAAATLCWVTWSPVLGGGGGR